MERETRSRDGNSVGGASVVGSVWAGDGRRLSLGGPRHSHLGAIERRIKDIMGTTPPPSVLFPYVPGYSESLCVMKCLIIALN